MPNSFAARFVPVNKFGPIFIGASVAVLSGIASATANDATVRIMTQNVYQGTNFDEIFAAATPTEFVEAVSTTYNNILATEPAERAEALAQEIVRESPDIVSLQEVASLLTGPLGPGPASTVQFNYLQLLTNDLTALGSHYVVAATLPELDAQAPSTLGFNVRIERGDAVLVRASEAGAISDVHTATYSDNPGISTPVGVTVEDNRGSVSMDVSLGGSTFRFVTTHLETSQPAQLAQMQELLARVAGSSLPVVIAGDFNANADDPSDPTFTTYQAALDAGFTDDWVAVHGNDPGFTCCQDQDLENPVSLLDTRIDLFLSNGGVGADAGDLIGNTDADRTPSGLWPADHAGVVATLSIPIVPELSTWEMLLAGFGGLGFLCYQRRKVPRAA